jgi:TrmH family RNA methyltransferase
MSLSLAKKKFLRSLKQRKYRYNEQCFLAEGNTLVADLLRMGMQPVDIFILDDKDAALFPGSTTIGLNDRKAFSNFDNPAGAAAVFRMPQWGTLEGLQHLSFVPALYAVQDPGNLGTILRTACWFGFQHILLLDGCADPYNSKAIQAGMGAVAQVSLVQAKLNDLQGLPHQILGAHMQGESLYSLEMPKQSILIFGNEGSGLPENLAYHPVSIPKAPHSQMESLNVAMAAGIAFSIVANS